ncbi:ABC transporter permease [Oceanivirga salmonicida]|uniref:ABC transporter permease n=1 Tax=Oceanivirga salmonicida TaxID=1769291 RepID=UPI0012E0D4CA|nr:ABC transporter permease subunit [Oceanivirga salmonicida]
MKYLNLSLEHIYLVSVALIIALVISVLLVYVSSKNKKFKKLILNLTTITYAIPSLSFFSLLIPLTGLGKTAVIIVLSIYAQYILVRSFITLLDHFDKNLLLAAKAVGLDDKTIFFKIKLPLLENDIFNSIKISISTLISIANIGSIVNAGGLGVLVFNGLRNMSALKIFIAIILNAIVYIIFSIIIQIIRNGVRYANHKYNNNSSQ